MEYFLGQILLLPYDFNVRYLAHCDGRSIQISENEALFSLLSDKYGGDGRTYFKLPDLRGAEPVPGLCYHIVMQGTYPSRS